MLRRDLLATTLVATLPGVAFLSACHRPPKKGEVLRSLVADVMATGIRAAVDASHQLQQAASRLAAAPSAATLGDARSAWVKAAVSWKRANAFRDPQLVASSALVRGAFWPPRPRAIDDLVRADVPLGERDIDQLGADVRSLYAMEYLLFAEGSGSPFKLDAADAVRARQVLVAYAAHVSRCAEEAEKGLASSDFQTKFAAQGQEALSRLIATIVGNVESYVANRLATIVWIASTKQFRAIEVEGGPSGSSHRLGAAALEVAARLYEGERGQGLAALVAPIAPAADERVRSAFTTVLASIHAFKQPLETVALSDRAPLDGLVAKCKALEVALRADLASTLGVTLTFTSADAD